MKTATEIHRAIEHVEELTDKGLLDDCRQEEQAYHRMGIDTPDLVDFINTMPAEKQAALWQSAYWELAEWHSNPDGAIFTSLVTAIRADVAIAHRQSLPSGVPPDPNTFILS